MPVAVACASHSPMLMERDYADAESCAAAGQAFKNLARFIEDFDPEHVIQFSPDHFRGFGYDLMPSFCIGAAATAAGDWHTQAIPLKVDEEFALAVLEATREADFDTAFSYDMVVDHGFTQIWEQMFGRADAYSCVPIFVNCIAEPLPTYSRARRLGEAVGHFAVKSGRRVLFAASGGLSHDPVVPRIRGATPEVRQRLIQARSGWREAQPAREVAVRAAAAAAMRGEGPAKPLNPVWDRAVMAMLAAADWDRIDSLSSQTVIDEAGAGANETLGWVAAIAALRAAGPFDVVHETYVEVPGWIVGLGTFAARPRNTPA